MNKTALYLLLVVLFCGVDRMLRAQSGESASQPSTAVASAPLILSAHSRIPLVLVRPVWAKTAKSGDPVYFETTFPVSAGAAIALPAGSFVQGRIEALTRPTGRNPHATLQILFTQLIYPNGYVVTLPGDAQDAEPAAIHMLLTIQVSVANDLLLDNGAQTEMELAAPLPLERLWKRRCRFPRRWISNNFVPPPTACPQPVLPALRELPTRSFREHRERLRPLSRVGRECRIR